MGYKKIALLLVAIFSHSAWAATPTTWTTTIDAATYNNTAGTIKFNDWGYKGPTGVGASDFTVTSPVSGVTGFDSSRIGQRQNVNTLTADGLTRDPLHTISDEFTKDKAYPGANMDGAVNFNLWGYTTPPSHFYDMQIDKGGNYFVARDKMQFGFYDYFDYNTTYAPAQPADRQDSVINFQPYAISDAKGWCGSVLASAPSALEIMAGQVSFGVAFDVYLNNGVPGPGVTPTTQLIPGFIMRSYGSYELNVTQNGGKVPVNMVYKGNATMNNTNPMVNPLNPLTGEIDVNTPGLLDPNYNNLVSFLGAGVIPTGAWVSADSYEHNPDGSFKLDANGKYIHVLNSDGTWKVNVVDAGTSGAVWHVNSFGGNPFMLRADGQRIVLSPTPTTRADWTDYAANPAMAPVPLPAATWLLGSGLLGLGGFARRKIQA